MSKLGIDITIKYVDVEDVKGDYSVVETWFGNIKVKNRGSLRLDNKVLLIKETNAKAVAKQYLNNNPFFGLV